MNDETFRIGDYLIHQQWWSKTMADGQSYLDELHESLEWELDDPRFDNLAMSDLPFDGCEVCSWREMMYFLFVRIVEGTAEGNIRHIH